MRVEEPREKYLDQLFGLPDADLALVRARMLRTGWEAMSISGAETGFGDCVVGSQFDIYCLHHPVLRNLDIKTWKHEGGFCGHFSRVVVSDFRSLRGDIVSEALSARQSPAAKIPFPAAGWSLCFSESSWPCHPGQRCV